MSSITQTYREQENFIGVGLKRPSPEVGENDDCGTSLVLGSAGDMIFSQSKTMEIVINDSNRQENIIGEGQDQPTPDVSENADSGISLERSADNIELSLLLENLKLSVLFERLNHRGITKIIQLGSLSDKDLIELKSSLKMLEKKRFDERFIPKVRELRQCGEKQSSRERSTIERVEKKVEDSNILENLTSEPGFATSQIQLFTYDDVMLLYEGILSDLYFLNELASANEDKKYIYDKLLNTKDRYRDICIKLRARKAFLESQRNNGNNGASSIPMEQHGIPYLRCKSIRRGKPPLRTSERRVRFANIGSLQHPTKSPYDISFKEQMRREREQGLKRFEYSNFN